MLANYHTHTWRCHHAEGTEREYVERAIEGGLKILGFSDHVPYPFPKNYLSGARMSLNQTEDYITTVLDLKKEYTNDIEIHLGFEAEYYPHYWEAMLEHIRPYPVEYLIMGQHHLDDEMNAFYAGTETSDERKLIQYVDQAAEGLSTGKFMYLAHPDLLHYVGRPDVYDREYRRLCQICKRLQIPIEINLLGIRDHRHYPNPQFWEIAGEESMDVVLGCDAHQPEVTVDPASEKIALEMIRKFGLHLTEITEIR